MKKDVPVIVLVVAILHFVGGGVGLIFDCIGAATQIAGGGAASMKKLGIPMGAPGQPQVDTEALMHERIPTYTAFIIGRLVVDTLLCVMLILAGVGLLKLQPWARTLSLVYALCSIVFHIAVVVYHYAFLVEVIIEGVRLTYDAMPEPARSQTLQMMPVIRVLMWFSPLFELLWIIYPVVVLVLLTRKRVVEAFSGKSDAIEAAPSSL